MLAQLYRALGRQGCCAVLGVSVLTLRHWIKADRPPAGAARRCIWFAWCLLFHPERLATIEDLVTWGRFHRRKVAPRKVPRAEWSEWSI